MKILVLTNEYPPGPGGIGNHAYHLTYELLAQGNEVVVCASQNYTSSEAIIAFNTKEPYKIISLNNRTPVVKYFGRLLIIARLYNKYKPDVVIASGGFSLHSIYLLRRYLKNAALISIAHGGEVTERNWLRRMLVKKGFKVSDKIISVSNYTKKKVLELGIDDRRCAVIYNGANIDRFYPIETSNDFIKQFSLSGKKILLTVGSVHSRKGHDIVLKALPAIKKSFPNILYMIVGKLGGWTELQDIVQEYDLHDNVCFAGMLTNEEILQAYNGCDIYVLSSRHSRLGDFEGFGISVIEAALCAKPAIVTNNCGLEDAVENNYSGYHIPQEDPATLAEKVVDLLSNDMNRKQLGENARKRALSNFDWKIVGKQYYTEIRDAVSQKK